MEDKSREVLRFYLLASQLKYKIRSGWDDEHWNISKERRESIAEHVYGTCILAFSIDSEFETNLDINKVVKMLVFHEIGEVVIGDITPFDNITPEEKMEMEHKAIQKVLGDLVKKDEFYELLLEFDAKETPEAKFAHLCDKIEADIQAKVYQDMGYHHSLDDQKNNVVFKSKKVQQMLKEGAQNAFDIWYRWDRPLYENDKSFLAIIDFIKDNNTQIFTREAVRGHNLYKCSFCGRNNVKLWRPYGDLEPLICAKCAEKYQSPLEYEECEWKKVGNEYIGKPTGRILPLPKWEVNKQGKIPSYFPPQLGPTAIFSTEMTNRLLVDISEVSDAYTSGRTTIVPAILAENGEFWGYAPIPELDYKIWEELPL